MKANTVGGGVIGLSTAWELAHDGHQVETFEPGALPSPLGLLVDEHRLIRHPHGDRTGCACMVDPVFAACDLTRSDPGPPSTR